MIRAAAFALMAAALCVSACGEDERAAPPPPPPPTLSAAAVPYLESKARTLSAAVVAREAGLPWLAGRLAEWGFQSAASRSFQGQSKRLQVVESRAYRFRTPAGAAALMRAIRKQPGAFFAAAGKARGFTSDGRRGIAVEGLPCSCHMAQPAFFAAVSDGATVSSLEINGARASMRSLRALAAKLP